MPADYIVGMVPGSDTGAFELAMWSLLGCKPTTVIHFESFSTGWKKDIVNELQLPVTDLSAPYGELPELAAANWEGDVVFTWNGTTSGVRIPDGDWIPDEREGLTLCDATSAVFAQSLPWPKLDVTTFSWQKCLGGEGGHGIIVLSPRAVERLETFRPAARPLPKIFRLAEGGQLNRSVFADSPINTPSMLAVEDCLDALRWAQREGGYPALVARANANLAAVEAFLQGPRGGDWIQFLAKGDPACRSNTSVCLQLPLLDAAGVKSVVALLEGQGVALDVGSYRSAPPGLRLWCGPTVEAADVAVLMRWVEWAHAEVRTPVAPAAAAAAGTAAAATEVAEVAVAMADDEEQKTDALQSGGSSMKRVISASDLTSFPKHKIKVLLMESISDAAAELLSAEGFQVERVHKLTPAQLKEKIARVHVIGVRSKTKLTKEVLACARRLMAVGCFCIGTDQTDLEAAALKGVAVFNSPYANTRSVAELVASQIIALARRWPELSTGCHAGQWNKRSQGCYEVRGKTLGIIGYGHVGSQLSVLGEALGMRVLFHDITPKLSLGNSSQVGSLQELLQASDFVSLHVPKLPTTRNLIGAAEIALMKPGSYLINASRGNVVVVEAAAAALRSGHLQGAAFDVFPEEPASKDDPFLSVLQGCPNTILTPHIGGSTEEAQASIGVDVATKLISYINLGVTNGSVNFPEASLPMERKHRILNVHFNRPGVLREINTVLGDINISAQHLSTSGPIGYYMAQIDQEASQEAVQALKAMKNSIRTRVVFLNF